MRRLLSELKIAGINFYLLSAALTAALVLLAAIAGNLLNLSLVGFELIYPFFAAIAVGEWGRTRSDANYDVIAAQGRSLFQWVAIRCAAVWGSVSLFALAAMAAVSTMRAEASFGELLLIHFPTSLFLSSLSAYVGLRHAQEQGAALVCGVLWLVMLLVRALIRLPGVEFFYLFIRLAGDPNGIWRINKGILTLCALALWRAIHRACRGR